MDGLLIEKVVPGSIAEELDIKAGDRLLAVSGHYLRDIIDFHYFSGDDDLTLEVVDSGGNVWECVVERDESEPLGLVFAPPEPTRCGNKCVFCFVHQLPSGLRTPLYVKDEDYRLSFLYGNYVTLANIGSEELARIKEQHLSPLYISVHATAAALREQLLGKQGILPILQILQELAVARITMHTQVVLCPGINDGEAFVQTVHDLSLLRPWVASLAVVPVGLTRHRQGLPRIDPVTPEYAALFIKEWLPRCAAYGNELGEPFLFLADEFFIKAKLPFPPLETYGDFPQLENGVGMIPLFLSEAEEVLHRAKPLPPGAVTIVSGESPYDYLSSFVRQLGSITGLRLQVVAVKNRLFGDEVTVTGLISGRDIIAALEGVELGDLVVIPDVMVKEGEGLFLDDLTVEDLEVALHTRVVVTESSPPGLYEALAERD